MNDTRLNHADGHLEAASELLERDMFEVSVVTACLDDARTVLVDLVEELQPRPPQPFPAVVNQLDSARSYINSAIRLVRNGWAASEAHQFVEAARRHVSKAMNEEDGAA